jgi:hypothetical protein
VSAPHPEPPLPHPSDDPEPAPSGWPAQLMAALELGEARPQFDRLTRLARLAAAASGDDDDAAATAFIAGYAAGLAEGTGQAGFERAHRASMRGIERLVAMAVTGDRAGGPAAR